MGRDGKKRGRIIYNAIGQNEMVSCKWVRVRVRVRVR